MLNWETFEINGDADHYMAVWGKIKGIEIVWEPGEVILSQEDLDAIKERLFTTLTDSKTGNRLYEQVLLKSAVNGKEIKMVAKFEGVNCFYNGSPAVFSYSITDSPN